MAAGPRIQSGIWLVSGGSVPVADCELLMPYIIKRLSPVGPGMEHGYGARQDLDDPVQGGEPLAGRHARVDTE